MSYRLRLLLLLTCAFIAGIGSLALTIQAARENRSGSPSLPSLPDGLVAANNPLDLGDVPQDILDGTFELANKSKKPVRMIQIVKSCRCTEIEAPSTDIAPGKIANVSFKWDSSDVRGIRGSSFTVFYLEEDRLGLRSLTLFIKGNVLPFFDFVPENWNSPPVKRKRRPSNLYRTKLIPILLSKKLPILCRRSKLRNSLTGKSL